MDELETLHPGTLEDTAVCYKNLARYDACFIAGSVATEQAGVVDCAAGAVATLYKADVDPDAADSAPLQTVLTDAFGDFKFDGLAENSGEYIVRVSIDGQPPVERIASLGRSLSLGTIMVPGSGTVPGTNAVPGAIAVGGGSK